MVIASVVFVAACGPAGPGPADESDTVEARPEPTAAIVSGISAQVVTQLREIYADFGRDTHYFHAVVDLNGDGADEVIFHVAGPMVCGTGGCDTLVFTPRASGYVLIGNISITRPPIRVSTQSTGGWRNLIVHISGGGIQPIEGEVPFDGAAYQSNPTAPMVEAATDLEGAEVVIPEFETFTDGAPLYTE